MFIVPLGPNWAPSTLPLSNLEGGGSMFLWITGIRLWCHIPEGHDQNITL